MQGQILSPQNSWLSGELPGHDRSAAGKKNLKFSCCVSTVCCASSFLFPL